MQRTIIMKKIPLIVFLLCAVASPAVHADESNQAVMTLGTFLFDSARLGADEASQVKAARSIGYSGIVPNVDNPKQLEQLARYQAATGDGRFKIHGGLLHAHLNRNLDTVYAHMDKVIESLKKSDAPLWLILRDRKNVTTRAQRMAFLRAAAERTKAAGIPLVMYPHYGDFIDTAETAIPWLEEVQNGNVYLSLHLCHELRAGNGDRLDEIAAKIKPWIALPTINGADADVANEDNEAIGWTRAIQPLGQGDYDSSKLVKALHSVGYKGPVILHTFGLKKAAADHHETSLEKFQEMVAALDAGKGKQATKRQPPERGSARTILPKVPHQTEASRITPEDWRAVRQNIRKASLEGKIEYLLDRAEIEDIITTYAYSVDTRDWPLHGALFKESFQQRAGAAYRKVDKQDRLGRMVKYFKSFMSTQHLGFPLVIQLDGDTAYATASLHARHFDESGDPKDNTLLFGQYEFWFERTAAGWKVSQLGQVNRTRINTSEAIIPEEGSPPRVYPKL